MRVADLTGSGGRPTRLQLSHRISISAGENRYGVRTGLPRCACPDFDGVNSVLCPKVSGCTQPRPLVLGVVARLPSQVPDAIKAADPNQTTAAVKAYQVLPASAVGPVAGVLPFLELAFGLLVLLGIGTRLMGVLSAALLLVYIAGVAQSWARG